MEAKADIFSYSIPGIEDNFHDYYTKKRDESQGSSSREFRADDCDLNPDPNGGGTDVIKFSSKQTASLSTYLTCFVSTSGINCYLHSEDQVVDEVLKLPNDETVIGLLETVESEEHKNVLPKDSEMDSINFIVSGEEDVFHEDLITQQRVKSYEICENEKSEAEPILTKDMMFQSVSDVKSFMSKYMNFSKSAFVIASSNQRQVNNITFTLQ